MAGPLWAEEEQGYRDERSPSHHLDPPDDPIAAQYYWDGVDEAKEEEREEDR